MSTPIAGTTSPFATNGLPGAEASQGRLGKSMFKVCPGPVRRAARAMACLVEHIRRSSMTSAALLRGGKSPSPRGGFRVIVPDTHTPNAAFRRPTRESLGNLNFQRSQGDDSPAHTPPPLPPRSPGLKAFMEGRFPLATETSIKPATLEQRTSSLSSQDEEPLYSTLAFQQRPKPAQGQDDEPLYATLSCQRHPKPTQNEDDEPHYATLAFQEHPKPTHSQDEEPVYTKLPFQQRPKPPQGG